MSTNTIIPNGRKADKNDRFAAVIVNKATDSSWDHARGFCKHFNRAIRRRGWTDRKAVPIPVV